MAVISCSVSRDELVRHNACSEGLALFDRILAQCGPKSRAKGRVFIKQWTPLHTVWFYVVGVGPSSVNALKVCCVRGHPLNAINNLGKRWCRVCHRERARAKRQARVPS